MKTIINILLVLAVILVSMSSVANAGIIDTFNTDQEFITAEVGETVSSSVFGAGILGGERDLVVTNYGALNEEYTAAIGVADGNMSFSAQSTVDASFWMQWDGEDNSSEVNTSGLMDLVTGRGVNFLEEGLSAFMTETVFADENYLFEVEIWWDAGTKSEKVTVLGPGHDDYVTPHNAFLNYGVFEFADLTDVTALVVGGNVSAPAEYLDFIGGEDLPEGHRVRSFDVTVGSITAVEVPEPKPLALMGIALLAMGVSVKKRKN